MRSHDRMREKAVGENARLYVPDLRGVESLGWEIMQSGLQTSWSFCLNYSWTNYLAAFLKLISLLCRGCIKKSELGIGYLL